MSGKSDRLSVLLLHSNEEATGLLRETLTREVELATAWTVEQLSDLLQRASYDAFLCDWDCQGGSWREVCREVKRNYPDLPIILLCRLCRCGGEKEWVEVLEAGYFDLVCAPFSDRQILSVIEHAVASREARTLLKIVA